MIKCKHVALALATTGLLATQAQADEAPAPTLPHASLAAFSPQDVGSLFDQADQPMQLSALSDEEMRETEGAWWFAPAVVSGSFGSAAYVWSTPNWTWSGVGQSFGAGATAGLWGATPVHWAVRAGGAAFGASSWYRW